LLFSGVPQQFEIQSPPPMVAIPYMPRTYRANANLACQNEALWFQVDFKNAVLSFAPRIFFDCGQMNFTRFVSGGKSRRKQAHFGELNRRLSAKPIHKIPRFAKSCSGKGERLQFRNQALCLSTVDKSNPPIEKAS
jgi:hypothetical protein